MLAYLYKAPTKEQRKQVEDLQEREIRSSFLILNLKEGKFKC